MILAWHGIDQNGAACQGVIESSSISAASKVLNQQNIVLLKIAPQQQQRLQQQNQKIQQQKNNSNTPKTTLWRKNRKIKPQQIADFMQQLSFLINAHIPLVTCFNTIAKDSPNPAVRELLQQVRRDIETGSTLTKALRKHPHYFAELWCNLINTGEQSGTLDIMLQHIATHIVSSTKQKRKVIKALLYPIAVLSIGIIVTAILLLFVIPQFQEMFANFGAALPAYTQFIIYLAQLLKNYGIYALLGNSIAGAAFFRAMKKSPTFAHKIDLLVLRLPWYGALLHKSIVADCTKILHITIKAGLPLLDALTVTAGNISNWHYQQSLAAIGAAITRGQTLHGAMRAQHLFSERIIQLVALGEETGNLDDMLGAIANSYEDEVNYVIDNLNNLLEPILMLILGVLVGGLIIGIYLPIFQLGQVM